MDHRIVVALKIISLDVRSAPAPRQLADAMGLSLSHFYNLFRKETGMVPAKYIRILRYEKARQLLMDSQFTVKEITHLAGINDVSHFVREFQKIYGASPTHFRRLYAPSSTIETNLIFHKTGSSANKP